MTDKAPTFPYDNRVSEAENAELERIFDRLGDLPGPPPPNDLRPRFDAVRAAYEQGLNEGLAAGATAKIRPFARPSRPAWSSGLLAAAATFAVLTLGLVVGRQLATDSTVSSGGESVATLRAEIGELSRVVTTTLLERGSASERLQAIEVARAEVGRAAIGRSDRDDAVTDALLEAVLEDPSANVRLAALEALAPLVGEQAALRKALAASLGSPQPPLVGVALVDTLLASGARGRDALREVATETLDDSVRAHLDSRLGAHL